MSFFWDFEFYFLLTNGSRAQKKTSNKFETKTNILSTIIITRVRHDEEQDADDRGRENYARPASVSL